MHQKSTVMKFHQNEQTALLDFEEVTELLETVSDVGRVQHRATSSSCRLSKRWSERENVILCGIVLDTYCSRHSLKPCNDDKRQVRTKGNPVGTLIWSEIQKKYTKACHRIAIIIGKQAPKRTTKALQNRWKDLGKEQREKSIRSNNYISVTKQRLRSWDKIYNRDNILLGSEENFHNKAWSCKQHIIFHEAWLLDETDARKAQG